MTDGAAQRVDERARLRIALDAAELGTWLCDLRTGLVDFDERGQAHYGVTTPIPIEAIVARAHPADRVRLAGEITSVLAPGGPARFATEYRVEAGEGRWRLLRVFVHVEFESEGPDRRPVLAFGTSQDVTDERHAQQVIQRFMAASPAVIYALGIEPDRQRLLWVGGDLERLTGWTRSEVADAAWWTDNLHPDDRDRVLAQNPKPYDIEHLVIEFRFRRKDGRYLWIHDERRLLRDEQGRPREVVGSWSDISERVELEERFRQAHKLEAIGQLAGGVAHDFNNLLTVILGSSDLLLEELGEGAAERPIVDDIKDAAERASALTRQLLAFSRRQMLQPVVTDVNQTVTRLERLVRRLIGEDVTVRCDLAPGAGHILIDPGQFEQAILNLVVNARDAMPRGGELALITRRVESDGVPADAIDRVPGPYVCLTVRDTGDGMAPDVIEHIFEPFFTTKPSGRGTGLGLATVFGVVRQSGGHVDVRSTPGQGSSFSLYFPRVSATGAAEETGAAPAPAGTETILVVDDEPGVRRIAAVGLARAGYRVVDVASGAAALARLDAGEPVDLLLTDIVMPEMSGPELMREARARRPGLPVIFISGYVHDTIERQGLGDGQVIVFKPFSPSALAARVRELLDAR